MTSTHPPPRVLVVEDNDDTRDLLVFALARDAYGVVQANCLADGLRALREGPAVDLVITDFSLGDGDGLEMVDRARREGLLAAEPVIVWTAHHNVRAPGSILVLQKPLGTDELLAAVRGLLHGIERRGELRKGPRGATGEIPPRL